MRAARASRASPQSRPFFECAATALRLRGALVLGCLAACAAAGGGPAPPGLALALARPNGGTQRGLLLRGPSAPTCSGAADAKPLVRVPAALALRGGADAQQGGAADQMAMTQVTDCKELVAALMSADNDVRVAAEKRYDALKVRARVSALSAPALPRTGSTPMAHAPWACARSRTLWPVSTRSPDALARRGAGGLSGRHEHSARPGAGRRRRRRAHHGGRAGALCLAGDVGETK